MIDNQLPVTVLSVAAAVMPILVLLVLLVGRGWSTSSAAPVALAVAVLVATLLFQTPMRTIAVAAGKASGMRSSSCTSSGPLSSFTRSRMAPGRSRRFSKAYCG